MKTSALSGMTGLGLVAMLVLLALAVFSTPAFSASGGVPGKCVTIEEKITGWGEDLADRIAGWDADLAEDVAEVDEDNDEAMADHAERVDKAMAKHAERVAKLQGDCTM